MADLDDYLDPGGEERRERDALAERVAAEDAWRAVLASHHGRLVLAALLRQSGYLGPSHTPGDPLSTAYREGARALGGVIHARAMALDPAGWPRLWRLIAAGEESA
ncbi:hypothetical protein M0638_27395 [Roseomonas sp. NAR14]|uniref:Bbp19-like phage domain-containing protein n=1 Tax=Roseomonas acroporae TaxID=2937791 RepID=A0A9X1YLB1_9PROT|nr:hypothetical protein [Roseomonas acroporae]MCK8788086.1 hypothetical protein [Roseomonas acroporae]